MSHPSQLARSVLAKSWSGNVPVDIVTMLKVNNIELRKLALPEGVRGKMELQPGGAVIYYNPENKLVVNRFMGAHLLGRFLLGFGAVESLTVENFSTKSTNPADVYANDFAMELLIPSDALRFFAGTKKGNTVNKAAELFCVAPVAMAHAMNKDLRRMFGGSSKPAQTTLEEDVLAVTGLAVSAWIGM